MSRGFELFLAIYGLVTIGIPGFWAVLGMFSGAWHFRLTGWAFTVPVGLGWIAAGWTLVRVIT